MSQRINSSVGHDWFSAEKTSKTSEEYNQDTCNILVQFFPEIPVTTSDNEKSMSLALVAVNTTSPISAIVIGCIQIVTIIGFFSETLIIF